MSRTERPSGPVAEPPPRFPPVHPGWWTARWEPGDPTPPPRLAPRPPARRREPEVASALVLGAAALVIPLLGPVAWAHATEELTAIAAGQVRRTAIGWLRLARLLGLAGGIISATCVLVAIVVAIVATA